MPNKQFMMTLDEAVVDLAQNMAAKKSIERGKTYTFQDILREQISMNITSTVNRFYTGRPQRQVDFFYGDKLLDATLISFSLLLTEVGSYSCELVMRAPLNDVHHAYLVKLPSDLLTHADEYSKRMYFTYKSSINDIQTNDMIKMKENQTLILTDSFEAVQIASQKIRVDYATMFGNSYCFKVQYNVNKKD